MVNKIVKMLQHATIQDFKKKPNHLTIHGLIKYTKIPIFDSVLFIQKIKNDPPFDSTWYHGVMKYTQMYLTVYGLSKNQK